MTKETKIIIKGAGLFIVFILLISVMAFGTRACGLWGQTYVERKVYEQSYQRQESLKRQISTLKANLAEVEALLQNPRLDEDTRYQLEAQARSLRAQIRAAEEQLK